MTDCCDDDRTFWQGRLDKKKEQLAAFDDAITAIAGGAQSYSLDTGQTRQVVTKANLSEMRIMVSKLESEIATLQQRLTGCGSFQARPAW